MAKLSVTRFVDSADALRHYLLEVDRFAESKRASYITPGAGQTMTYEAKHREALAGGGPLISAEAEALGMTVEAVIESVLMARAQWETVGAQIEAARLKAKKQIRAVDTPSEMYAVVKALQVELRSI